MADADSAATPCELQGDEFMVGPGGFTTVEFDGTWYVTEEQHLWTADFAYCAIERLERVLAEAERRGIDRKVMEEAMRHERFRPSRWMLRRRGR